MVRRSTGRGSPGHNNLPAGGSAPAQLAEVPDRPTVKGLDRVGPDLMLYAGLKYVATYLYA